MLHLRQLEQFPQSGVSYPAGVLSSSEILLTWTLVDIFIFKEKFPLKFAFEHKSLKEDQALLENSLTNFDKKRFQ